MTDYLGAAWKGKAMNGSFAVDFHRRFKQTALKGDSTRTDSRQGSSVAGSGPGACREDCVRIESPKKGGRPLRACSSRFGIAEAENARLRRDRVSYSPCRPPSLRQLPRHPMSCPSWVQVSRIRNHNTIVFLSDEMGDEMRVL